MKNSRLGWGIAAFVISLSILIAVADAKSQSVSTGDSQSKKIDGPTVIQRGVMTDEQRAHSKLFLGLGVGQKITDLIKTESEVRIVSAPPLRGDSPSGRPLSVLDLIGRITCNSDSVLIGSVISKTSQLTADEDYVFTDFAVNVETTLKEDPQGLAKQDSTIVITRPGGSVILDGHLVTAENEEAGKIRLGKKYLLFLTNVPNSKGFTTLNNRSVALVDNGKLESISADQSVNIFRDKTLADVVDMVRASMASGCEVNGSAAPRSTSQIH